MVYRIACLALISLLMPGLFAEELTLKQTDSGYEIRIGNQLFAGYITDGGGSPILYPIVGPTGKNMTRNYPMKKDYEPIQTDHPHQRSMWFAHGDVNGCDFWTLKCKIVHKQFTKAECDGNIALLVTENDWLDSENQVLCRDVRMFKFFTAKGMRGIDFDITVIAEQDNVVFGDTKEGNFGIRVTEALAVNTKQGGQFVNAEGKKGEKEAWGKRSAWLDYHGILDGEKAGIAILNHPSSFRFPTYWQVRDYGLFAANAFGIHEFNQHPDRQAGNHTLAKGEAFTLRYRVLLHKGDAMEASIAEAFEEYRTIEFP